MLRHGAQRAIEIISEASRHVPDHLKTNGLAIRCAVVAAGIEFIDENGGGPGVRLRERQQPKKPK